MDKIVIMIEFIVLFLFMFILSYHVTRVFRSTRGKNKLMDNLEEYEKRKNTQKDI